MAFGEAGVKVSTACELCGKPFDYVIDVVAGEEGAGGLVLPTSWNSLEKRTKDKLREQIRNVIQGDPLQLKHHKCPKCGYVQSWMRNAFFKKRLIMFGGLCALTYLCIGLLILLVTTIIMESTDDFIWMIYGIGVVSFGFIAMGIAGLITWPMVKGKLRRDLAGMVQERGPLTQQDYRFSVCSAEYDNETISALVNELRGKWV
jgi:hypothetical protein